MPVWNKLSLKVESCLNVCSPNLKPSLCRLLDSGYQNIDLYLFLLGRFADTLRSERLARATGDEHEARWTTRRGMKRAQYHLFPFRNPFLLCAPIVFFFSGEGVGASQDLHCPKVFNEVYKQVLMGAFTSRILRHDPLKNLLSFCSKLLGGCNLQYPPPSPFPTSNLTLQVLNAVKQTKRIRIFNRRVNFKYLQFSCNLHLS